ncbi:hypothetical protein R3P38DRAFT_2830625 [Favolaschia claudopus]|uniref:RlpA-like protein double-psi beta-barrel domain-containing protein n=1 Tax=Favolaschia claudopus TaxID=2862362 RepID=A0AAW0EB41_9AGAR
MTRLAALAFVALCLISPIQASTIGSASQSRAIAKSKYMTPHSLGDSYDFDSRDGWQTVNASSSQYKHRRDSTKNNKKTAPKLNLLGAVSHAVSKAFGIAGMKGTGDSQPVIVTWYTGHDLLNPSCWSDTHWAPTDESFVCALTLQGWHNKPQCFKFLEICRSNQKCIFVRVVDTCAGCADASHHVDLTKGSFGTLADPNEGLLTMQLRPASDPNDWFEELWGPRTN